MPPHEKSNTRKLPDALDNKFVPIFNELHDGEDLKDLPIDSNPMGNHIIQKDGDEGNLTSSGDEDY